MFTLRSLFSTLFLLCICPSLAFSDFSLSQKASAPAGSPVVSSVQPCGYFLQQVRLLKNEIVLGEPLVFEFIIRSKAAVREFKELEFSDDLSTSIELYFKSPSGMIWKYTPSKNQNFQAAFVLSLGPGQTYRHQFVLSYDSETVSGSLFDEVGNYSVFVRKNCTTVGEESWLEFEPLPFIVKAPEPGTQDEEVLKLMMKQPDAFQSFQSGIQLEQKFVPILQTISSNYPQSKLYPFALYALALSQFREFGITTNQELLKNSHQYNQLLNQQFPEHELTYRSSLLLLQTFIILKDLKQSQEVLLKLLQNPKFSSYFTRAEFMRLDAEGKSVPFILKDWMIFELPEDGCFTAEEYFIAPVDFNARIEEVKLDIFLWDNL